MEPFISSILLGSIPDLYKTEGKLDPICHVKLFTPDSSWTWYIIEFSKEDNDTCFGYVVGLESELGYFSLNEIEQVQGPLGLKVARDLSFKPTQLSAIQTKSVFAS